MVFSEYFSSKLDASKLVLPSRPVSAVPPKLFNEPPPHVYYYFVWSYLMFLLAFPMKYVIEFLDLRSDTKRYFESLFFFIDKGLTTFNGSFDLSKLNSQALNSNRLAGSAHPFCETSLSLETATSIRSRRRY